LSPDGTNKLKTAAGDLDVMIKKINDISTIDRLESSLEPPTRHDVAVQDLLARACDSLTAEIKEAETPINCEATSASAFVDAEQIERVLINMLSNAIKFSQRGEPIRINVNDENGWVEMRISDSGSGVPFELQDCLFDRYKPYKDADRRVTNGTGLGLPLCKAIIEAHGGDLGVVSEPDKGSMFWFRIQSAKRAASGTISGA
ncbi:MAG: sensor histidine kinase, partial [Terriglobales bacterium]